MRRVPAERGERAERGVTLIELMISLVVVAIAVGFIFRIYATTSMAYRAQTQVAEVQQTLRAAREKLVYDIRMAGYFAESVVSAADASGGGFGGGGGAVAGGFVFAPVAVINDADGPDELRIVYADTSCMGTVECKVAANPGCTANGVPAFNSSETKLTDDPSCFQDGDIAMAVRTKDGVGSAKGDGCVLAITGVQPNSNKVQHNPGQGAPWNQPGNSQCDGISLDWSEGYTMFLKFQARAYRIKPADRRGVLQVSESGGLLGNDWQDLAVGIVDMQVAVRQYQPGDLTDDDGDGDPERDWLSGENMEADLFTGNNTVLQVRISLLARTFAEIEGVGNITLPSFSGGGDPDHDTISDRNAVDLATITDPDSPYYGNYVYRFSSTLVDVRNLGVGI